METIFVFFFGILTGILTGLLPGIHVNLVSSILLFNLITLKAMFTPEQIIFYIFTTAITQTFIDIIPNIFFMIPDPDNSISILPAQRMLIKGESFKATYCSGLGSLTGAIISIILIPLLYKNIFFIESIFRDKLKIIFILVIIFFILQEEKHKKFWALIIVTFSGILGLISLNSYFLKYNLTVIFSGLFGASSLIISFFSNTKIPKQNLKLDFNINKDYFKITFLSSITSLFSSIFPGVGNAQAISILSLFFKKISSSIFLFGSSLINTLNFIFSVVVFINLGRVRNGVLSFISNSNLIDLNFNFLGSYVRIVIGISITSFFILLFISFIFIKIFNRINLSKYFFLSLFILLTLLIFILSGLYGLLFYMTSILLGLLAILLDVRRINLMAVIIVPIIFLL